VIRTLARRLGETALLVAVLLLAYGMPAASGRGWLEATAALLLPILLLTLLFRGRHPAWIYLALLLGFLGLFHWVPRTVAIKGGLPPWLGLLSGVLLYGYEALGLWLAALAGRWAHRRSGPRAAACAVALALLLWESRAFHIYDWSLGAALGGLPWLSRTAAFLGSQGLAALLWGTAAWTASSFIRGARPLRILAGPGALLAFLLAASGLWLALPRGPQRVLDVVMIQPNFEPGLRRAGMEEDLWLRSDRELARLGLPRADAPTLLLWPESAILGRDDWQPRPRLALEARRRGIAWLFGTEGRLNNLVRGEVAGQPSFIQAKTNPMAFGERMPGPPWLRAWLDRNLGFLSQEPGTLSAASSFQLADGLRVHPLICSEALSERRVQDGIVAAGADLLSNHTNDGWFEESIATDLHAGQIRMRAVEAGLPLVRATLTGKSGLFREDGSWELWGRPMTEAAHGFRLTWRPIGTPARKPWLTDLWIGLLAILSLWSLTRRP
jgi:apolipoprotein N-acyltransferase